jgi:ubiquinone/menaquinone biosynthesis C-methylase UbiE
LLTGWEKKRKVIVRYNCTAEMYEERYAEEQKAKYKAALENINLSDCIVLDAGCGTGLFLSQIANVAKLVVGIDISHKLLLKAWEKSKRFENVLILRADLDYLPFSESFFDGIFAFTVLQNMPNHSRTVKELRRISKSDARIVLTGLKKAFPQTTFIDLIENSAFKIICFIDNEDLKCNIAILAP